MVARMALSSVHVDQVRIVSDPKVTVNALTSPRSATVEFRFRASGKLKGSGMVGPYLADLVIYLDRVDDLWLVTGSEDPQPFSH